MKQVTILKSVNSCIDKDLMVYPLNVDGTPDIKYGKDLEVIFNDIVLLINECWNHIPEEDRPTISTFAIDSLPFWHKKAMEDHFSKEDQQK